MTTMAIEIRCSTPGCGRFLAELATPPNGRVRVHCSRCGRSTTVESQPVLENWRGYSRTL